MLDVLCTLSLAFLPQNPDLILLKSGRELTGKLLSENGSSIRFDDKEIGHVVVARTEVRAVLPRGESDDLFGPDSLATNPRLIDHYFIYRAPTAAAPGALLSATTRWYHEPTDTTLFLVGNSRVAESTYYTLLQNALDSMDLVLFEGAVQAENAATTARLAKSNIVLRLQLAIEKTLDLEPVSDHIDTKRRFWRRSEIDLAVPDKALEDLDFAAAKPQANIMLERILAVADPDSLQKHPRLLMQIRNNMAPLLVLADQTLREHSLQNYRRAVLESQSEHVLSDLAAELETGERGRRIAIFYGAEHMPDLDIKLRRDWTYQGSMWHEVYQIHTTARHGRPPSADFEEILEQAIERVHPHLELSVWLGLETGRPLFEHASSEPKLATRAIAPLLLVELFAQFTGQLDDPPPNLDALVTDPNHLAMAAFDSKQRDSIRQHLAGLSVRRLGTTMIGGPGTLGHVRDAAMNVIVALLGGPDRLARQIRRRHPALSQFDIDRYPFAQPTDTPLGVITTRGLASILQGLANHDLPGIDVLTLSSIRDLLFADQSESLGRHFATAGGTDQGRLAITRAGFYEQHGYKFVYVVHGTLPDLDVRERATALLPLHLTADWLALHLTISLKSAVQ